MKYGYFLILLFLICLNSRKSFAQDTDDLEDIEFIIERSQPLTIDLEEQESQNRTDKKKKKRKRNVFYGIKTKRAYTRKGYGDDAVVEIFHYLKEWRDPNPYAQDVYWYDFRRKQIRNGGRIDLKYGRILHGTYKKIQGEQLLEEGIYYIGTKHGRWVTLNKYDVLIDKRKYYKGWPKESLVKYYDEERTKLKEVIPVVNGEKQGDYYFFHDNGVVAIRGQYEYGEKVGKWTEYYNMRGRAKKQVQYKPDPFMKDFEPYIIKEWNQGGTVVYELKED
jgi:antitoxin component YwqK of YwqJK toxin-antitoxin module